MKCINDKIPPPSPNLMPLSLNHCALPAVPEREGGDGLVGGGVLARGVARRGVQTVHQAVPARRVPQVRRHQRAHQPMRTYVQFIPVTHRPE